MNAEKTFNAIFWALFVPNLRVIEQLFWLLVAVVVLLWFQGNILRSLPFPAPDWLRWAGLGLAITNMGLFAWTHTSWDGFGPLICNFALVTG